MAWKIKAVAGKRLKPPLDSKTIIIQNTLEIMIGMDCGILKLKMIRIMNGLENNIVQGIIEWIKSAHLGKRRVWLVLLLYGTKTNSYVQSSGRYKRNYWF